METRPCGIGILWGRGTRLPKSYLRPPAQTVAPSPRSNSGPSQAPRVYAAFHSGGGSWGEPPTGTPARQRRRAEPHSRTRGQGGCCGGSRSSPAPPPSPGTGAGWRGREALGTGGLALINSAATSASTGGWRGTWRRAGRAGERAGEDLSREKFAPSSLLEGKAPGR